MGAEFQVDVGAVGNSYYPNVDIAAHGTFVVVWSGDIPAQPDVFGQRFDATGNRLGGVFRANDTTAGIQTAPRVAMSDDGTYVVTWQDRGGNDGSGHGVFGQHFAADGAPIGAEFQVNTSTAGNQFSYGVARGADGRFVVSWDGPGDGSASGIIGQRYDATAVPEGPEFAVNQDTSGVQAFSSVATDHRFNFVAVAEHDRRRQRVRDPWAETRFARGTARLRVPGEHVHDPQPERAERRLRRRRQLHRDLAERSPGRQLAVFVLRTLDEALVPPACATPVFADVPASSGFCPWIEELFRRGVVTGCGGGNYARPPLSPARRWVSSSA